MKNNNIREYYGDLILLSVAAIWGGGFVAGKMALESFSPVSILMLRFCGSAILLWVSFRKRIVSVSRDVRKAGFIIGAVQFVALLVQLIALKYTTPMKQSFLAATYVVFTPFVAWIAMKKAPSCKDVIVAFIALAGVGLISMTDSFIIEKGDFLTLSFTVLFSLQIILIKKLAHHMDSIALTFYQFISASALSMVTLLGRRLIIGSAVFGLATTPATIGLIYIVVINTALAICLQNYGQKLTNQNRAALILSMESVFGFVFSVIIYNDPVSLRMIAGCILVFIAVITSKWERKKPQ